MFQRDNKVSGHIKTGFWWCAGGVTNGFIVGFKRFKECSGRFYLKSARTKERMFKRVELGSREFRRCLGIRRGSGQVKMKQPCY
jgi:hypothetical protein